MLFNIMANNTNASTKTAAMMIVHGLSITQSGVIDKKLSDKKTVPAAIDKTCTFQIRAQYTQTAGEQEIFKINKRTLAKNIRLVSTACN